MVGFGANRRGGRLPSFILVALMVVILILSFNYWAVSNKHGRLLDELAEVQTQVKRTDAARSRLEKRNSELMVQVDTHRKQIDQKEGDYTALESKLQTREAQMKKCTDEKVKLQSDVTAQTSEIQRLKEQLKELRQEFMKQEDQLREVRRNNTHLERKLEYESLQCGRQIAQLKDEYEDRKKTLEEEAAKLKQSLLENRGGGVAAGRIDGGAEGGTAGERHTEATHRHDSPELKAEMGKPGSDAGMPGIEDSEVGKVEDLQFALKKPAITQKQLGRGGEVAAKEERAVPGQGGGRDPAPGLPDPQNAALGHLQQPLPQAVGDRPVLFDEDNKVAVHADELGENRRQLRAPDGAKADGFDVKGVALPPPPNPDQVLPNPMEPQQRARDPAPAQAPRHRQSRFFDENESPVDPQHGSKLADYNGDDGNVGEYEADKQAELAYNEEEDGDGGEEDVQDDEDRELQGDRPVDYGKRHQAIDIL
ncbi:protein GOLM2-like isoform X1 [Megalops cyprinoides]|uniref:protein GOLM2-like isoform X1 n=1 Tax=Megalops cyprinoides TaxID=118141 RepID=UPI00186424A2|nr:protein GOLM2-like isoform X1 [Megalops cyprinoides]